MKKIQPAIDIRSNTNIYPSSSGSHSKSADGSCADYEQSGSKLMDEFCMLDMALSIQSCGTWDSLAQTTVSLLHKAFNAVDVRWVEVCGMVERGLWSCASVAGGEMLSGEHYDRVLEGLKNLDKFHQSVVSLMTSKNAGIRRLCDCYYQEELHRNSFYQKCIEPLKVKDIVCFQAHFADPGAAVVVGIGLPHGEFSELDKRVIKYIASNVRVACLQLSKLASSSNMMQVFQKCRESVGEVGLAVVSTSGSRLWEVDESSLRYVIELGGRADGSGGVILPEKLQGWLMESIRKEARASARAGGLSIELQTRRHAIIEASLYLERAGYGGILVLEKKSDAMVYQNMFTSREMDVIRCLCKNMTNREASGCLKISKRTVDKHLEHIYSKLGVGNRISAVAALKQMREES